MGYVVQHQEYVLAVHTLCECVTWPDEAERCRAGIGRTRSLTVGAGRPRAEVEVDGAASGDLGQPQTATAVA